MKAASLSLLTLYLRLWPRIALADSPSLMALALLADGVSALALHRSHKESL
ncbi:MAG: hypothetical protein ACREHF_12795 [Rhizomicrobium sp.]